MSSTRLCQNLVVGQFTLNLNITKLHLFYYSERSIRYVIGTFVRQWHAGKASSELALLHIIIVVVVGCRVYLSARN